MITLNKAGEILRIPPKVLEMRIFNTSLRDYMDKSKLLSEEEFELLNKTFMGSYRDHYDFMKSIDKDIKNIGDIAETWKKEKDTYLTYRYLKRLFIFKKEK